MKEVHLPPAVPTFVTFYTDESYRRDAERLGNCCRHFALPFLMIEGEELGSWKRNCSQKPRILERIRREVKGPLVFLDSDCVIHRQPAELLGDRAEDAMLREGGFTEKPFVGSAVTWWNDTLTARAMIADWSQLSGSNPDSLEDPLLKAVCLKWRGVAKVGVLPRTYDKPYWRSVPGVDSKNTVISTNERRCAHPDAVPKQNRKRIDPLWLPYEQ